MVCNEKYLPSSWICGAPFMWVGSADQLQIGWEALLILTGITHRSEILLTVGWSRVASGWSNPILSFTFWQASQGIMWPWKRSKSKKTQLHSTLQASACITLSNIQWVQSRPQRPRVSGRTIPSHMTWRMDATRGIHLHRYRITHLCQFPYL